MGIGRVLGAAAPIAAGYFAPSTMFGGALGATGSAIATGALTGAGIAALTGEDPLMGGITGGLGGMGGGAFRTAADATKLASAGVGGGTTAGVNSLIQNPEFISPFTPAGTFGSQTMNAGLTGASMGGGAFMPNQALAMQNNINATNKLMGPNQLNPVYQNKLAPNLAFKATPDAVDPTALQGGYESLGTNMSKGVESAKAAFDEPGEFLKNLGDGNKTIGAAKAGITASGPIMAAFEPEVQTFDELRGDKYDPTRSLNLDNIDTGIGAALKRDTGLRLLADGGYLETGGKIGDGMSDDIRASINNQQEARLSDGEFVIPADVVSHLGNGSSDAGAKRLYSMMDKVRQARTGTKQQGKEISPERYMPA